MALPKILSGLGSVSSQYLETVHAGGKHKVIIKHNGLTVASCLTMKM
jgi:hemin uptake protein HemP